MTTSTDIDVLGSVVGWYQGFSQAQGNDCANGLEVADWLWLTTRMQEVAFTSASHKSDGVTARSTNDGSADNGPSDSGQHPGFQNTPSQSKETASISQKIASEQASMPSPAGNDKPNTSSETETESLARLSTSALPNQRDVNESLQSYSDWLVASGGQPLRLHTPPLFPSVTALLKPLKSLFHQELSSHLQQLDEERSAERSAAIGMVSPVYRPKRWPSLHVRLVLDAGVSMAVWDTLAKELKQVLASSQAFAQVSKESLQLETLEAAIDREKRLQSTTDGPTITLLISDTAGVHWWDCRIQPWLQAVGCRQPMAVLHILPYRYRKASALTLGTSVTLHNGRKLAANSHYGMAVVQLRDPWADEKEEPLATDPPIGAVIPVISLNPKEAKPWAALVMGDPQSRCPGVVLAPAPPLSENETQNLPPKPSPQDLLQGFQRLASPEAQSLLEWMAGSPAPITLGVMRLLQGALRQQVNGAQPLAEVLISGLLERLPDQESLGFEEMQFQVIPSVRSLLLTSLDPAVRHTVLHLVTQVLERHWNRRAVGPSFEALITDPSIELPPEAEGLIHIANLTADMLDELPGQQFESLAKKIRSRTKQSPSPRNRTLPNNIPDFPETYYSDDILDNVAQDGVNNGKHTKNKSDHDNSRIASWLKRRRMVYVSSTYIDLKEYRAALKTTLEKAGFDVASMEKYPAFDERPLDSCLADVAASDVFVLLLAHRYGYRPPEGNPDGRSITQLEYEEAVRHPDKPRLVFAVDPYHPWSPRLVDDGPDKDDLARFRAFVEERHGVWRFTTPDDLSSRVLQALSRLDAHPVVEDGARVYTPQELQSWVERHHPKLERAVLGLPSVQARQVHVPLDVCLTLAGSSAMEGPRLLVPEDLEPVVEEGGDHVLLLSGVGGAGKTSLAFAIARWWLEGKPGGVVRLPVLIETAIAPGETVVDRVRSWLRGQLAGMAGASEIDPPAELVEALLAAKRLVPIIDHLSELTPAAREQLLAAMPPGLVVVTSRSDDDGFRERPLSRIVPQRIAVERLQAFFLDYLRRKGQGEALSDDDLMPAQTQLKRIVGDKPITVLLAQMFIDDVIAHREGGLLAGSEPELMLSYVRRLDTPDKPEQRQRAGLVISPELVQRALRVVALRSHRQGAEGKSLFQPLEFSEALARQALMAQEPEGMALTAEEAKAVLGYLIELRLLLRPGVAVGRLRFPLDPLVDHLAAAEQFERLEEQALVEGAAVWEDFLASLEPRSVAERERMRGFLLALRDGAMEAARGERALAMPADVPDRLAALSFLDAEGERYRLALQRARRWMWELDETDPSDRRYAITKLAAMAAGEPEDRRAVSVVATDRLSQVLVNDDMPGEEREDAALVLGLIGSREAVEALETLATQANQQVPLRRMALEALGMVGLKASEHRRRVEDFLERQLRADALDLRVKGEEDWAEHDARLPLLQGASRGLQLAASAELPLLGSAPPKRVPMLTLTALQEGEGLRIRTEVVEPEVWRLPLPEWPGEAPQQLELVVVPGGLYEIGSPEEEAGRDVYTRFRQKCEAVDVEALRRVDVKNFALVRHPITQAQWRAVAALPRQERDLSLTPGTYEAKGLWESHAQPGGLAVDSVTWNDCQEWLKRLNSWLSEQWLALGGQGEAPEFGLPSESQWEAACRAASGTPFHFGDTLDVSWANYDGGYTYGLGRKGIYRQRPVPVGSFGLVNRWGLAELHGQLLEWCADQWHRDPVDGSVGDGSALESPDAELEGNQEQIYRLLRGGSWINDPRLARAAVRLSDHPGNLITTVGVRPGCFSPPGLFLYT